MFLGILNAQTQLRASQPLKTLFPNYFRQLGLALNRLMNLEHLELCFPTRDGVSYDWQVDLILNESHFPKLHHFGFFSGSCCDSIARFMYRHPGMQSLEHWPGGRTSHWPIAPPGFSMSRLKTVNVSVAVARILAPLFFAIIHPFTLQVQYSLWSAVSPLEAVTTVSSIGMHITNLHVTQGFSSTAFLEAMSGIHFPSLLWLIYCIVLDSDTTLIPQHTSASTALYFTVDIVDVVLVQS